MAIWDGWHRYSCYICGQKATGPRTEEHGVAGDPGPEGTQVSTYFTEIKDLPKNIFQCKSCGNWACWDHIDYSDQKCIRCEEKESRENALKQAEAEALREANKPDWQKRIEAKEKKDAEDKRKAEEQKRIDDAKSQELWKQNKLAEHKAKFFCHICRTPSSGPGGWDKDSWDSPTGLTMCSICGKWTCEKDLYHGICKFDAH